MVSRPVQASSSNSYSGITPSASSASISSAAAVVASGTNTAGSSGLQTPHKRPSVTGTDRQTFYKVFTAMLKSNQVRIVEIRFGHCLSPRQIRKEYVVTSPPKLSFLVKVQFNFSEGLVRH